MSKYVVDTNVAIVANGPPSNDPHPPSIECRRSAVRFLMELLSKHTVLLDQDHAIQKEYSRHLRSKGQPGVGDRFYMEVLKSAPNRIERVDLPKRADGEYQALPQAVINANFDPDDRKFAALAAQQKAPVANATDSDWLDHKTVLQANGIRIHFVCGCHRKVWFEN